MSDHWKALADRLGAPGLEPSARRTRETAPQNSSTAANPVAPDTSERIGRSSPSGETADLKVEQLDISQAQDVTRSMPDTSKKKKRSNWERVANLFGITSQPEIEEPAPPADSIVASGPSGDAASSEVETPSRSTAEQLAPASRKLPNRSEFNVSGLFDTAPDEVNPALAEMFGYNQPNYADTWEKSKRLVDDVGWEEPTDTWEESPDGITPVQESSLEEPIDPQQAVEDSEDSEFPRRRSRRRRRRGRRSDREPGNGTEVPELNARPDRRANENLDVEDYTDVESRSPEEELPESELPDRRSSRRRPPRKRDGFDLPVAGETRKGHAEDSFEEPLDVVQDSAFDSRRAETEGNAEQNADTDHSGRRRRRRSRGGSSRGQRSEREDRQPDDQLESSPLLDAEDLDADDLDDSELHLAERSSDRTSRNIPTWDETLSVLINANMENHRRNESRGSRGGGRPKGRR